MPKVLDDGSLDLIFRQARSHNAWQKKDVADAKLRQLYDVMRWGPTSANSNPARFLFLKSAAAKQRLKPALSKGNVKKAMTAPVVAVIGYDLRFYERLATLFAHEPGARSWFDTDERVARTTAFRNGTLQGAYLIVAARALGLDCGPMSGFDNAKVDREFFPDGRIRSNFLCCIGYGDPGGLFDRNPRLAFDEACRIL